jgi:hypothetical protein
MGIFAARSSGCSALFDAYPKRQTLSTKRLQGQPQRLELRRDRSLTWAKIAKADTWVQREKKLGVFGLLGLNDNHIITV